VNDGSEMHQAAKKFGVLPQTIKEATGKVVA